jgi:outer membrane receptor protein involved in Fe transport
MTQEMSNQALLAAVSTAVLFSAPLFGPQRLFAQTPAPASGDEASASRKEDAFRIEEIVVTATRREENLQNVPTSITAISAKQLEEQGITSTTGIANSVVGLQVFSPNSGTDNFFSIRGVTQNDYAEHEESPIAVYIDGAYMSQSAGTSALLFDTERVEVLRGPQGTLFGRNATGGLVQYISRKPTDTLDGYAQATVGNYASKHVEAAVGDKITDGVSLRISAALDYANPYLTNELSNGHDPGNRDSWATRAQLRLQPNDSLQIDINLHGTAQHVRSGFYKDIPTYPDAADHGLAAALPSNLNYWGSCPGCDPAGYKVPSSYNFYTGDAAFLGYNNESTVGDTTTITYSTGDLNITSISDITRYNSSTPKPPSAPQSTRPTSFPAFMRPSTPRKYTWIMVQRVASAGSRVPITSIWTGTTTSGSANIPCCWITTALQAFSRTRPRIDMRSTPTPWRNSPKENMTSQRT